jgi:hypothetical protein
MYLILEDAYYASCAYKLTHMLCLIAFYLLCTMLICILPQPKPCKAAGSSSDSASAVWWVPTALSGPVGLVMTMRPELLAILGVFLLLAALSCVLLASSGTRTDALALAEDMVAEMALLQRELGDCKEEKEQLLEQVKEQDKTLLESKFIRRVNLDASPVHSMLDTPRSARSQVCGMKHPYDNHDLECFGGGHELPRALMAGDTAHMIQLASLCVPNQNIPVL